MDSQSAGGKVWIRDPVLFTQGKLTLSDDYLSPQNFVELELPDIVKELSVEAYDGFWKHKQSSIVNIQLDQKKIKDLDQDALLITLNGPNVDYIVNSQRIHIEASPGSRFVFKVDLRTENLSGNKGIEIAIGWFDSQGNNLGWSESQLLRGTNQWNTLQVTGEIPNNAVEMSLVPLRIFDSAGIDGKIWLRNVRLYFEKTEQ